MVVSCFQFCIILYLLYLVCSLRIKIIVFKNGISLYLQGVTVTVSGSGCPAGENYGGESVRIRSPGYGDAYDNDVIIYYHIFALYFITSELSF